MPGHISAFIVGAEKWKYWGDNRNTSSFRFFSGTYGVDFGNKIHLELLNENKENNENKFDKFIYNRPSALLKGILVNKLHYDFTGEINIISPDYPGIICNVEYLSDYNEEEIIEGSIVKGDNVEYGDIIYKIGGNFRDKDYEIYATLLYIIFSVFME